MAQMVVRSQMSHSGDERCILEGGCLDFICHEQRSTKDEKDCRHDFRNRCSVRDLRSEGFISLPFYPCNARREKDGSIQLAGSCVDVC